MAIIDLNKSYYKCSVCDGACPKDHSELDSWLMHHRMECVPSIQQLCFIDYVKEQGMKTPWPIDERQLVGIMSWQ